MVTATRKCNALPARCRWKSRARFRLTRSLLLTAIARFDTPRCATFRYRTPA